MNKVWTRKDLAALTDAQVAAICHRVSNRVCKWRSVFAGWQLGTRTDTDAESRAVRDHREATLLRRVEGSALVGLLIEKGVFTAREWTEQYIVELEALDDELAKSFPGMTSTDEGIAYQLPEAARTMQGWPP